MSKIFIGFAAVLFLLAPLATPAITMTSPNGGETLTLGTNFPVTWTAPGVTQNVKLILLREDNSIYEVIIRDLAPGGSPYNWPVGRTEAGTAPAGRYKIRVSTMDGGEKDVSDAAFTISDGSSPDPTPAIRVTSPNGGETWALGSSHPITWNATGLAGTVNVSLLQGGAVLGSIGSASAAAGSLAWTVGNYSGGTAAARSGYRVRVTHSSGAPGDDSNADFTIGPAEGGTEPPPAGSHDFVVSDPAMEWGVSNRRFKINVTDLAGDYEGTLIISHYCGAMGLGHAVQQHIPVRLQRGVPSPVRLADLRPEYFTNKCDVNFVFQVNPDHAVTESNYGNNSMQKKFCWEIGRDGRFFSLRMGKNFTSACEACSVVIRPADVESVDGDTVRIRLEITLQNCGQMAIRDGEVIINESWDAGRSVRSVRSIRGIDIEPGHFKLMFETVSLERHAGNGLHIDFKSGDNDTLNANNAFHCHPNFIGF